MSSNYRPNVVLLDIMMPVMDGEDLRLEKKRDRSEVADVPAIVASVSASNEVNGATAVFGKSCDVDKHLRTVARVVLPASAPPRPCPSSIVSACL